MVMVRSLQMPSKTIWRLRFLFGLGGLLVFPPLFIPFRSKTILRGPLTKSCVFRAGLLGFVKMGVSYASLEDCELLHPHDIFVATDISQAMW